MQETTTSTPQVKTERPKDIHTFKIKPLGKGENVIICQFTNKANDNKLCSLLTGGKFGRFHEGPVPAGSEVMVLKIAPYGTGQHDITVEADINNMNDEGMKVVTKFWSKHPIITNKNFFEQNPNQIPSPEYELVDTTIAKENRVEDVKRKRTASLKYEAMGARGQKNVGYFFGISNADDVYEKDENELYVMLLDTGGKMYEVVGGISNLDRFLGNPNIKTKQYPYGIPEYSDSDERSQLVINTGRAIEKGIIAYDQKTYTINNYPVGASPEDVVGYLDTNRDFYHQHIIEKLGDAALQERKEKRKLATEVIETIDVAGLKAKAKDLFGQLKELGLTSSKTGVSKWAVTDNPEKLNAAIAEAEEMLRITRNNTGGAIEVNN